MQYNIVYIITGLSTGGAEMMLLKLLERIDRSNFAPMVISLTTKGEIGPRIEALGIPVKALNMHACFSDILKVIRLIFQLRVLRPNIVHTWMYHSDLLGGLAATMAGIRSVVWGIRHSNLDRKLNKRTTIMVMKICALLSHCLPKRILSCSEKARAIHVAEGYAANKMVVIANGFDLDRFCPSTEARMAVRAELGLPSNVLLVGLIARYDPQKNIEGFIEAAAYVANNLSNVNFLLVGRNVDNHNLKLCKTIQNAGIINRTHLLGRKNDIPRLMAALDVLTLSSHGEAFPNVVGEAMSCGVPCVVTDAGDSSDIVGNTGRVVMIGEMTALANEVIELLKMPHEARRFLGKQARQRVQKNYEIGSVVRSYETFYLSLLEE